MRKNDLSGAIGLLVCLAMSFSAFAATLEDGLSALDVGDYKTAHDVLLPLAEAGNPDAQVAIGNIYDRGLGVEAAPRQADHWYGLAAKQGNKEAAGALENMSARWYRQADIWMQAGEGQKAWMLLFPLAQIGEVKAQMKLANMYLDGDGVEQSDYEAFSYFKSAADKGRVDAQFRAGRMLEEGQGIKQNDLRAAKYFQMAAAQGHVEAEAALKTLVESGRVPSLDEAGSNGYEEEGTVRPKLVVIEDGDVTRMEVVGEGTFADIRDQVIALGEGDNARSPKITEELLANKNANPAPFLFELAIRLSERDAVESHYWFNMGSVRARYDAMRCIDQTAMGGVTGILMSLRPRVQASTFPAIFSNRAAQLTAFRKLLASGDLFTSDASPWWICSHGLKAQGAAMGGAVLTRDQWLIPEEDWPAVQQTVLDMLEKTVTKLEAATAQTN